MSSPTHARHARPVRHRTEPRREWCVWTVSLLVRFYFYEDGGPKTGLVLASLFLAFAVVIGAAR